MFLLQLLEFKFIKAYAIYLSRNISFTTLYIFIFIQENWYIICRNILVDVQRLNEIYKDSFHSLNGTNNNKLKICLFCFLMNVTCWWKIQRTLNSAIINFLSTWFLNYIHFTRRKYHTHGSSMPGQTLFQNRYHIQIGFLA